MRVETEQLIVTVPGTQVLNHKFNNPQSSLEYLTHVSMSEADNTTGLYLPDLAGVFVLARDTALSIILKLAYLDSGNWTWQGKLPAHYPYILNAFFFDAPAGAVCKLAMVFSPPSEI